jgi:hypothetical protein
MSKTRSYNEAGRRLQAAVISYQMGYKGVDRILKTTPAVVDESWADLARSLIRHMLEQHSDRLLSQTKAGVLKARPATDLIQ